MLGPLACLGSMQAAEAVRSRGTDVSDGSVIIIVMWAILGASAVLVVRAYLKARKARSRAG
jgi:hypothetical protein